MATNIDTISHEVEEVLTAAEKWEHKAAEAIERKAAQRSTSRSRRAARRAIRRATQEAMNLPPDLYASNLTLEEINETGGFIVTRDRWYC